MLKRAPRKIRYRRNLFSSWGRCGNESQLLRPAGTRIFRGIQEQPGHGELIPNFDCVLLGAFERHNFGDLLMGYIFEVLLGRIGISVVYASILENDLSSYGGAKVYSIFDLLDSGLDPTTPILHVGGEVVPTSFHDALLADSPLNARSAQG